MKDRFSFGFVSGVISGLVLNTINLISYYLAISNLRYLDFMAIIIYGNKPMNSFDTILALIMQLGFTGVLGVIYIYLTPFLGTENHLFKGIIYGISVFFVTYAITYLFKVTELMIIPPYTVASDVITSAIFGLILAKLYKKNIGLYS